MSFLGRTLLRNRKIAAIANAPAPLPLTIGREGQSLGMEGNPLRESVEDDMAWKKPRVTEISVAMEINCYACAEV